MSSEQIRLVKDYIRARKALLEAGIIRKHVDPIPSLAEFFVARLVDGKLAKRGDQKGWDVTPPWDVPKIQVKSLNIPMTDTTNSVNGVTWEILDQYDVAVLRFDSFEPTRLIYVPQGHAQQLKEILGNKDIPKITRSRFDQDCAREPLLELAERPKRIEKYRLELDRLL